MGDRANIYLYENKDLPERTGIFLYTHWQGYETPEILRRALAGGRNRWGDDPYLSRIIASHLFAEASSNTGYGLSTRIGDNQHPLLCVNLIDQRVGLCRESDDPHNLDNWRAVRTFEEYAGLPEGVTWEQVDDDMAREVEDA